MLWGKKEMFTVTQHAGLVLAGHLLDWVEAHTGHSGAEATMAAAVEAAAAEVAAEVVAAVVEVEVVVVAEVVVVEVAPAAVPEKLASAVAVV